MLSYAQKLSQIDSLRLEVDVLDAFLGNTLQFISLLTELEAISDKGGRLYYLVPTKGRWETRAQVIAMAIRLRTSGFSAPVKKDLFGRVYSEVRW